MFRAGEAAVLDRRDISGDGSGDRPLTVHEVLDKAWFLAWGDIQHIVQDEDLPRAILAGSNADGRNMQGFRNFLRELCGNAFEY